QSQMLSHPRWNGFRQIGGQVLQGCSNDASKPLRSKPPGPFIDRNNAPDLQLARALVRFDLAIEGNHLPRDEFVLKISRVKPQAPQSRPSLSNRQLEDGHAASSKKTRIAHLTHNAGHLARA